MKYNVEIDLKPQPVLQELIKDLTNKMLSFKKVLQMEHKLDYTDFDVCNDLEDKIEFLDQVIERCYAQQELIDLRNEQLIGLN
tara:strand:+ start:68 stop:316 length:249 start_codon:yes stop_codon:yes gene_type:complete